MCASLKLCQAVATVRQLGGLGALILQKSTNESFTNVAQRVAQQVLGWVCGREITGQPLTPLRRKSSLEVGNPAGMPRSCGKLWHCDLLSLTHSHHLTL